MEAATETLRNKTKKLVAGGSRYSESLEEAFQESLRFADCIEEFCSGTDDPNSVEENFNVGGPTIARFVQTIRELSSFIELLRTQVELIMCNRLDQRSTLMATEVRDARKRLNQRSSDYDAARSKHLGHRTLAQRAPWSNNANKNSSSGGGGSGLAHLSLSGSGTGTSPERGQQVMNAARSAADEARFDLARKLVEVQVQSRYEFLESIASVMQAHLKYYEHGHNVVDTLGPYIDETLQLSSRLKTDAKAKQDALEDMITLQREADHAREAAAAMGSGEPSPTYRGGSSSFTSDGHGTPAGGPLQMNIATSALASELESYIRATHESGGTQVTVLRQGWLLKQSSNFKSKWQRRFFVLDSTGTLYYYSNKTGAGEGRASLGGGGGTGGGGKDSQQRPHHTVNLLTATVKPGAAPPKDGAPAVPFAFRVVSPEREYTLQAEDEFEMQQWMESLQSVIACLLSGVIDIDVLTNRHNTQMNSTSTSTNTTTTGLPPPPARATHTRAISIDLLSIGTTGRPGTGGSTSSITTEGIIAPSLSPLSTTPSGTGGASKTTISTSSGVSTQALIAAVPGNTQCADCGAAAPDWGSLNLGTLHCIECSGVHRKLGAHISKIRSLTLDVRVWEPTVVTLFQKIGNTTANAVWEGASGAAIAIASATASPVSTPLAAAGEFPRSRPTSFNDLVDDDGDEEWVWGADDSTEDLTGAGGSKKAEKTLTAAMKKLQTTTTSSNKNTPAAAVAGLLTRPEKPSPSSSSAAKESFIFAKYIKKAYLVDQPPQINLNLNQSLWTAVLNTDVVATYQALVYGADVSSFYITSSDAAHLVEDTHTLAGGALERVISNPRGLGDVTITHLAASKGDPVLMELLLQWGAPTELKDGYNRTPLMYSVLHDHPDVARQLLKRGVAKAGQDVMGNSLVQMMGRKGLADAELVAALH
jgi:Arf-GAP/coiled-coil/ANK repeat/PH domain-containing protein